MPEAGSLRKDGPDESDRHAWGRARLALLALLAFLAGLATRAGVAAAEGSPSPVAPGTREMAALLEQSAALVNPMALSLVVNDRRADLFARELTPGLPAADRLRLRAALAMEQVNAGRLDEALETIRALEADGRAADPAGWPRHEAEVRMLEAVADMRMAEEANCHLASNRDACLAPIRGQGIHQRREGSTRAVQALTEVLRREPDNLRARWLLNIAHMTLGSWPGGVPVAQRIPASAFASESPLPRFPNVAAEAGLDVFQLSGGAILDDFDGDGRLDLMVSSIGFRDPLRLFHNRGDRFEEVTVPAGLTGETGGLNLLQADFDNDGRTDALLLRGGWLGSEGRFPLSLLRNQGDGTFADVTRAAGLLRFAPTQTAAWLDYDGDGWLDLFVGNESTPGESHPCELFHNNGDGTFTNLAREAGVDFVGFVKGVVAGDYDNDGRPDLFVSVFGGDNLLLHNDGPAAGTDGARGWRFTNVAAARGVTAPRASFGALFFDYDNDGWLDLFVAGYGRKSADGLPVVEDVAADYLGRPSDGETGRLYHNEGGTFRDVTREAHLDRVVPAMGLNFGDLDGDGWLDLYEGTGTPDLGMLVPNRMFRNAEGRVFQDVTTAGDFGHLQKGHAVAFGDVDNDGAQDVFEEMGGAYLADKASSALYLNPGHASAWLGLELEGVRSNRKAIGARIRVVVGPGGRSIFRTVGSGGSFGASPLRQEIGLGTATTIERVEVSWPATGRTQTLEGLRPRHRYHVREGSSEPEEVEWPRGSIGRR